MAPLRSKQPDYTPTIDLQLYRWGLDCRMVELSDITDVALPPKHQMVKAVTDSINYHFDTTRGRSGQHALHSTLTAAKIHVSNLPTEAVVTADGPDGVRATTMGNETATFAATRKVVLSLTSPLSLIYATTLRKITIHLMPDPINRFHPVHVVNNFNFNLISSISAGPNHPNRHNTCTRVPVRQ
jgi:hypothetical protein